MVNEKCPFCGGYVSLFKFITLSLQLIPLSPKYIVDKVVSLFKFITLSLQLSSSSFRILISVSLFKFITLSLQRRCQVYFYHCKLCFIVQVHHFITATAISARCFLHHKACRFKYRCGIYKHLQDLIFLMHPLNTVIQLTSFGIFVGYQSKIQAVIFGTIARQSARNMGQEHLF